jgi:hypothetical protein
VNLNFFLEENMSGNEVIFLFLKEQNLRESRIQKSQTIILEENDEDYVKLEIKTKNSVRKYKISPTMKFERVFFLLFFFSFCSHSFFLSCMQNTQKKTNSHPNKRKRYH